MHAAFLLSVFLCPGKDLRLPGIFFWGGNIGALGLFCQESGKKFCPLESFRIPQVGGLFKILLCLGIVTFSHCLTSVPIEIDGLDQGFLQGGQRGAATRAAFRQFFRYSQVAFAGRTLKIKVCCSHWFRIPRKTGFRRVRRHFPRRHPHRCWRRPLPSG